VKALALRGAEAPLEPLVAAATADPVRSIRGDALQALQAAHPDTFRAILEEAEQVLQDGKEGPYYRPMVERCLVNLIRDRTLIAPEAVSALEQALASPYPLVRWSALSALEVVWVAGALAPESTRDRVRALRTDPASRSVQEEASRLVERFALLPAVPDTRVGGSDDQREGD
jgi:hypothetical protein